MSLLCRATTILEPTATIRRSLFRSLTLVASAGLLISYGSIVSAMAPPTVVIQENDEQEDHNVEIHKHHSDGEIEVIVVKDGEPIQQELVEMLESDHLGQLHELAANADGNVEVIVIQDDDFKGHKLMLKKLKTDLKGQLQEIISDGDNNIEVVVLGEGGKKHDVLLRKLHSKHKGHLHKLDADSDRDHNVFVLKDDEIQGDVKMDLHGHLAELLHGQKSGEINQQALARKLRQLADRLETKNNEPHSAHKTHGKIEIHPSGKQKFHIEKRGSSEKANHREFKFTTDEGKHIVIGNPGQTGTMVIDLKQDGGGKLHSLDGDQKKIIWHGKEHDAGRNVVVEMIHLDKDHNSSDLAQKIVGRFKKHSPKHKVVIEKILQDRNNNLHSHQSHASEGKNSDEGLDASIRDLKNEIEELRRELKELRSDRKRD